MKAFRVITVSNGRAHLAIFTGETQEEIRNKISRGNEIIEIKDVTNTLPLDIYEISEALNYFEVNKLEQLLVLSILENYDNILY